ncbi:alpha/beta hydrolase domain-containing protein [Sinomonas sp. ASV486]|uniref:alpha/beta hydrolase domain-containing protein n=1 Tax=Sinomonas sp. ASV486 TaxID=3051170 RepID=UPI0027DC4FE2|nr:alpha/beta hydrolase domain-containing protein [Sinomonas sp. ASV486]MDQ4488979.1 alpha/beta hydrolase domain-containing protein [Sinomonas sp. ASV486]
MTIDVRPLPITPDSLPFGTSVLPSGTGIDLAACGYVEEEFLFSGTAYEWAYNDDLGLRPYRKAAHPYTTRVLVRRPADAARASGAVQLEPLHPNLDRGVTWRTIHPWILRNGHTWVGVTQAQHVSRQLRERVNSERYADVSIPADGLGYDILGQVAVALRTGALPLGEVTRLVMSGWSATGSFCRVFSQDGFHELYRLDSGAPAVDGYIIGISSGSAGLAGYPPLSAECLPLPANDGRRTISGRGVPIFEVLSEFEAETHHDSLRPDSDSPEDRYRLYQIAGTSHAAIDSDSALTNTEQWLAAGGEASPRKTNEEPSDARMDFVVRALYQRLDEWITRGIIPPRAEPFAFADESAVSARMALARDSFGNVTGGVRTPWVEVPKAAYLPHSTPAPGCCLPPEWAPMGSPEKVAAMVPHMVSFTPATLTDLYASEDDYMSRFGASTERLVEEGLLLREEADELLDARRQKVAS